MMIANKNLFSQYYVSFVFLLITLYNLHFFIFDNANEKLFSQYNVPFFSYRLGKQNLHFWVSLYKAPR